MRKTGPMLFVLLLLLQGFFMPILLAAQESDDPAIEIDWDDYSEELYARGDQVFIISLGTVFPVLFYNNGTRVKNHNFTPPVGGGGSLSYNYFLTSSLFIGGEIGVQFLSTLANNTLFMIPLGARVGYQFVLKRFEFPLSAALGMTWCRKLSEGYYGLYARGGVGAYFRATHSWSFGVSTNWYWYPQWTDNKSTNAHGNFIDTKFSARYHF